MHPLLLIAGIATASAQPSAPSGWSNPGTVLTLAEARSRIELIEKLDSVTSQYSSIKPNAKVRVVEGDLTVTGPLLWDWDKGFDAAGLVVTGSLTVHGPLINSNVNGGPFLLVAGTTRAQSIVGGGAELAFLGDAVVDSIVIGEYNDGILRFGGKLTVPVAVTNDHDFSVAKGVQGRWLDPFNEGHSWTAVLHPDVSVEKDDEGTEEFDVIAQVVPRLLAGQPVLRADLPPIEEYPFE